MTKRTLIKYIAMLVCLLLTFSLFACVAQPVEGEGDVTGLTSEADVNSQEIASDGGVESEQPSEAGGENNAESDGNTENGAENGEQTKTETETQAETQTETETKKEQNNGMGYVPL